MSSQIILEDILLRPIVPEDNAAIARIIRATLTEFGANHPGTVFTDPTTDDLYTLFRAPGSFYQVAVHEGELLGGAGIFPSAGLPAGTYTTVADVIGEDGEGSGGPAKAGAASSPAP